MFLQVGGLVMGKHARGTSEGWQNREEHVFLRLPTRLKSLLALVFEHFNSIIASGSFQKMGEVFIENPFFPSLHCPSKWLCSTRRSAITCWTALSHCHTPPYAIHLPRRIFWDITLRNSRNAAWRTCSGASLSFECRFATSPQAETCQRKQPSFISKPDSRLSTDQGQVKSCLSKTFPPDVNGGGAARSATPHFDVLLDASVRWSVNHLPFVCQRTEKGWGKDNN